MFKRLVFEDSTLVMAVVAFAFTFTIFAIATIRAIRLPKERRDRLAAIPLDDRTPQEPRSSR
jgi:hypothetical protein